MSSNGTADLDKRRRCFESEVDLVALEQQGNFLTLLILHA